MELMDFFYSTNPYRWIKEKENINKMKMKVTPNNIKEKRSQEEDIAIMINKTYLQTRQQVWENIAYSEMNLEKPARSKLTSKSPLNNLVPGEHTSASPVIVGRPIPVIGPSVPMPVSGLTMTLLPPGHIMTHSPLQSVSPVINVTEDPLALFDAAMRKIDAKKSQRNHDYNSYSRGQDYSSRSLSTRRGVRSRSPSPGKGDNKRRRLDTEQRRRDRKMSKRDLRHKLRTGTWRHQGN